MRDSVTPAHFPTLWQLRENMFINRKIKKILNEYDDTKAIIKIDELLTPIYGKHPEMLSAEEKIIVLIEELERGVNNGGFQNFFSSSAGNFTKETLWALATIKSKLFLEIFQSAIGKFPNGYVPSDQQKRQIILEVIQKNDPTIFEDLNWTFYHYDENLYALMRSYMQANIRKFR
jgi:hypothetical protein